MSSFENATASLLKRSLEMLSDSQILGYVGMLLNHGDNEMLGYLADRIAVIAVRIESEEIIRSKQ